MNNPSESFDVGIIGGGLAGMTLALQLIQKSPGLAIVVLERSRFPPPTAAHKVGESTVEVGAHYLAYTLGLRSLLESRQLRKFGLRFFFGGNHDGDLAKADELGASNFFPVISYQLDRGLLEADLAEVVRQQGVQLKDDCIVKKANVLARGTEHELTISHDDRIESIRCHWMIDASARSAVLKRRLDIGRPSRHRMCAAWFRLDAAIDVDDWSEFAPWKARCNRTPRRLSTNHLMGSGYWAWIIPLAGDRTSVGLVTDPNIHPLPSFNTFDKFRNWLSTFEPQLAAHVANAKDNLMDFRLLGNLSCDCKQVWSGDRWGLTGESGLFADPFYSPGTDFIAIGNTFLSSLITSELSQMKLSVHASVYQTMYQSFFANTMSLYEQQYTGFGDTRLMVVKTTWDYSFYWSVLAWLFFREILTDISFVRIIQTELNRVQALNASVQKVFRKRASAKLVGPGNGRFFDQSAIPVLPELNAALLESTDNAELEFKRNCKRLEALAPQLLSLLDGAASADKARNSLLGDLGNRFS